MVPFNLIKPITKNKCRKIVSTIKRHLFFVILIYVNI